MLDITFPRPHNATSLYSQGDLHKILIDLQKAIETFIIFYHGPSVSEIGALKISSYNTICLVYSCHKRYLLHYLANSSFPLAYTLSCIK